MSGSQHFGKSFWRRPLHTQEAEQVKADWRQLIHGKRQSVVAKFLSNPEALTPAEFLLLSDLGHGIIRSVLRKVPNCRVKKRRFANHSIEELFAQTVTESDPQVKGRCLEEMAIRLFNVVPGFTAKACLRTQTEEIDLFVLNGSHEAPWRDMGPALIGECKNWSRKCGTQDFNHFESKVRNRRGHCKCGFFISWNGFTSSFVKQRLRTSREDFLIVLVEGKHIEEAIAGSKFPSVLYRCWEEALQV